MTTHAGLYIHIPFCQSKCGYCSFNSVPADRQTADEYLQTILTQAGIYSQKSPTNALVFDSIFFGGGTPTLASADALGQLLRALLDQFNTSKNCEISIESNPNTVRLADLQTLRQAGFNRISFGVQSFHDNLLHTMERSHSGTQAREAISSAREAGFDALNCDLIYGLPEQTTDQWQDDLHTILELQPEHLSLYELSVDPDTSFYTRQSAGALILPDDDALADMEEISTTLLAATYDQYEISNFARGTSHQCRHNLTYWHNGTYLGLGAGAVSCIHGERFTHEPAPTRFIQQVQQGKSTIIDRERLAPKPRFRESIIMGLRLVQGVDIPRLEHHSQLNLHQVYGTLITELIDKGHLQYQSPYLRIPPALLKVANQILHQLV